MKYWVAIRQTGDFTECFDKYEDAIQQIKKYEEEDRKNGDYEPDYYVVKDEEHLTIEGDHWAVIDEWIEYGGIIYTETNIMYPNNICLCTSDDAGVIYDIYAERPKEFADMSEDEYIRYICRCALERFLYSDKVDELMNW